MAVQIQNPDPNTFVEIGDNSVLSVLNFAIMKILLPLAGLISLLFIMIGGYQYMTAGINEEQAEQGKKTLQNAIIGLLIILLSYTVISIIFYYFAKK